MDKAMLYDKLKVHNQEHLLRFYDELNEDQKKNLTDMICGIDFSVIENREASDINKGRGVISPLKAMELDEIRDNESEYEQIGLEAIRQGKIGAVLLAGGQGTRLGSDAPKGMYNIGETKDVYIFERIVCNLLDVVKKANAWIPLFVMTSEKNHTQTVEFFKEKKYFGYNEEYVVFFMQEMAASTDYNGKVYLEAKDRVSMSPNGNGGWFSSMIKWGALDKAKEWGVSYLNVFAVDNVLQRIADPVFVGAVIDKKATVGAKVVRKADKNEKVGVICLEDGRPSIVEYYELTEDMKNDLYNFGVILNYLFEVDELEEICRKNMPLHIVEKKIPYIDENGELISPTEPNGYKYETLVLDMIHLMTSCLPFEVVREKEFAPIKNRTGVDSVDSARELLKKNGIEI